MALLELKNISKIYGELKALDNVSLHVDKGEWVAIMGPSGSGKSTMMNIIGCMDKPTKGEVLLDGVDISKESSKKLTDIRRDKIGLIFQQFHMVNYLTAVENVMVSQYYHSMPDEEEALEALGRVGLRERAKHLPSQLSGGEQQPGADPGRRAHRQPGRGQREHRAGPVPPAAPGGHDADRGHPRPRGRRGRPAHHRAGARQDRKGSREREFCGLTLLSA